VNTVATASAVSAFEAFYTATRDNQVAGVTRLLNGDHADAEDVVQQAMMELYIAWPTVARQAGWLTTACDRKVWKRWSGRSRAPLPLEAAAHLPGMDPDPSEHAVQRDRLRAVAEVLSSTEMAIFQAIANGYTLAQIADARSTTVAQLRTTIQRARHRLDATPAGPVESEEDVLAYCLSRLERLPSRQRDVATWAFWGTKPDAIASRLGISANTARVNLHHAKRALAQMPGAPAPELIDALIRTLRDRVTLDRSTAQLLRAAARGEQEAWTHIVDDYHRLVWSVPRSLGLSAADAADVSQIVWLRLVENLDAIRDPDQLAGWLATVARRESLRLRRRNRQHGEPPEAPAELTASGSTDRPENAGPDRLAEDIDGTELWKAFSALPTKSRNLLRVVAVAPQTSHEHVVATALGMRVSAVGPARDRAIQQLKRNLTALEASSRKTATSTAEA